MFVGLAFAVRRAMWAIPTLFGVSFVVFLLTTLLPDPGGKAARNDVPARLQEDDLRRARFLDLPRFFNVTPQDVRSRVDACVAHIVTNDDDAVYCERRLAQIGGAGLPYLLPRLDDIPPAERGRIAMALAPVARRMAVGDDADFETPERAALFWSRFWEDRSIDFTEPAVRRAVSRFVARNRELLGEELKLVDTFALQEVVANLRTTKDPAVIFRLTRILSHVTGRDAVVPVDAEPSRSRAVVQEWLSWWYVHETDYVTLKGEEKVLASIAQTRYAKWVLGAVTGQLGLSTRDGAPVFDKLLARAPVTLGMALVALLLAGAIAIPLGVWTAWRRGHPFDIATGAVLLTLYSIPTFLVAQLLSTFARANDPLVLPVLALTTVSLSVMTQQQRASMLEALGEDYVRTARAKGARTLRVAVVHALRNALVPTVTLVGVQLPALIGAAFVVEEVFDVHGMGWETLRAIEARDAAWIVAVTLLCAVVTTASLVLSDVAYGILDPRVREQQMGRR
ncbi:Dipeptide transport system permease protein DppB [Labilithrix luteola]|uniref:Dipeptide transport system permease protein DppB n=1 Tax=Labilithrix luteola TaxID=1391654 RepID=A0A0K1PLV2_9BACT|nr:ABC transporter permease [Labilithrix luteola]AKU94371.1 Dipeptide transport system permease protein DppB [Labilithrix luteola]